MKLSCILLLVALMVCNIQAKKKKIPKFEPILEMREVTIEQIQSERDGSFDKQVMYVTFRKEYVDSKGLLEVTNHYAEGLNNKGVVVDEYVQINARKVGVVITTITDMMEIKEYSKARKSVLMVKSGEERIIGAHVTEDEKKDLYSTITGKKRKTKGKKKKKTKQVNDDL
ncbi:unnamed protein product [Moneuplotes crassus]|uniref:Uncharacterized protein n=1 Tax=Euplotes crassus TaxID=5936 RepID=A0AAD1Y115_EUPCR|nr:unnamed protein product [Moneuplotes crassus]